MIVQAKPSFDELVIGNQRLVGAVVKQWRHVSGVRALGWDDACGIGFEALCRAARDYDPGQGRFSTLAGVYIRNAILSEARRECKTASLENPDNLTERPRQRYDIRAVGWVAEVLDKLTPTDRALLRRRYGLQGCPAETTAQIAAADGVTVRTVRCRLRRVLERARSLGLELA